MEAGSTSASAKHRVLLVCDMFHPDVGGVEAHLVALAGALVALGHSVAVLTRARSTPGAGGYGGRLDLPDGVPGGDCAGFPAAGGSVRYLRRGIRVYRAPCAVMGGDWAVPFPTVLGWTPLLRSVLLRERSTVLHCHQSFSTLALEALLCGRALGVRTLFTDHSLLGLGTAGQAIINKLLKFLLAGAQRVVCVSGVSRENTVLRGAVPPGRVHVVPNGVDGEAFAWPPSFARPGAGPGPPGRIPGTAGGPVVVTVGRLTRRKGAALLARVLPLAAAAHPDVRFVVAGGGPCLPDLRAALSAAGFLSDGDGAGGPGADGSPPRVSLLGSVPASEVPAVLASAHVFLCCSLTESFGMAVVEAACAGEEEGKHRVGGAERELRSVGRPCGGARESGPDKMPRTQPPSSRPLVPHSLQASSSSRPTSAGSPRSYPRFTTATDSPSPLPLPRLRPEPPTGGRSHPPGARPRTGQAPPPGPAPPPLSPTAP